MQDSSLNPIIQVPDMVHHFAESIKNAGGEAIIVGGYVRDHLMGLEPKDLDIEIHGLPSKKLIPILKSHCKAKRVGKHFQVWKCQFSGLEAIDVSIPCHSDGKENPYNGFKEAASRRDFRFNAMGYGITSGKLLDPFNGIQDIQNRKIRAIRLEELRNDPLRLFRSVQFSARFEFDIDPQVLSFAQTVPVTSLPPERVTIELEKIFRYSKKPSWGLRYLSQMTLLKRFLPTYECSDFMRASEAVDRLRGQCKGVVESDVCNFWVVLLSQSPKDTIEGILDTLDIQTRMGYPLRTNIILAHQHYALLCQDCTNAELNQAAESLPIQQLCHIAAAICPMASAQIKRNQDRAMSLGILNLPMPILITGGLLAKNGYRGKQIGEILKSIRMLQIQEKIRTGEEALLYAQSHHSPTA